MPALETSSSTIGSQKKEIIRGEKLLLPFSKDVRPGFLYHPTLIRLSRKGIHQKTEGIKDALLVHLYPLRFFLVVPSPPFRGNFPSIHPFITTSSTSHSKSFIILQPKRIDNYCWKNFRLHSHPQFCRQPFLPLGPTKLKHKSAVVVFRQKETTHLK